MHDQPAAPSPDAHSSVPPPALCPPPARLAGAARCRQHLQKPARRARWPPAAPWGVGQQCTPEVTGRGWCALANTASQPGCCVPAQSPHRLLQQPRHEQQLAAQLIQQLRVRSTAAADQLTQHCIQLQQRQRQQSVMGSAVQGASSQHQPQRLHAAALAPGLASPAAPGPELSVPEPLRLGLQPPHPAPAPHGPAASQHQARRARRQPGTPAGLEPRPCRRPAGGPAQQAASHLQQQQGRRAQVHQREHGRVCVQ